MICYNAYDLRYFGHHVHLSFIPALSIRKLRQPQDLVIAIADGDTNYLPVEHKTPVLWAIVVEAKTQLSSLWIHNSSAATLILSLGNSWTIIPKFSNE